MMRLCGRRYKTGCAVMVCDDQGTVGPLDPRHDLRNHSPDGFEWGYGGSGPAQLALAMCAWSLDNDHLAEIVYQRFKDRFVASIEGDGWDLSEAELRAILDELVEAEDMMDAHDMQLADEDLGDGVYLVGMNDDQAAAWPVQHHCDRCGAYITATDRVTLAGGRCLCLRCGMAEGGCCDDAGRN